MLPLHGIEILDVGTLTPGKFCTFLLRELGAGVVRVERPVATRQAVSREDVALNRGKRSLTLDLRQETGVEIFRKLAARTDVVLESYRPGVAQRLGIGYQELRSINPRLVYCSLSGFGQEGPDRSRAAYDLGFMGRSGMLRALFGSEARPGLPETYLADAVSGLVAALGISTALLARGAPGEKGEGGEGRYVDLAMFDALFSMLAISHGVAPISANQDAAAGQTSSTSPLYGIYEAADGECLTLAALRPTSCSALFEELGRPELADQVLEGTAEETAVAQFLRETFAQAPAGEWIARLAGRGVEIEPVAAPDAAFDDPQLLARGMVVEVSHPDWGRLRQIASPLVRGADEDWREPEPAPAIGEQSEQILAELGYAKDEIERLREQRVI